MNWAVIAVFGFLSIFAGLVAALFGGLVALVLFVPILPMIFLLRDYRIGVVCLMLILPFIRSPLLPQAPGFNIYTYLLAATFFAFLVQRAFQKKNPIITPPRIFLGTYLLPVSIALLLALPNLSQASIYASLLENADKFQLGNFVVSRFIKPIGIAVTAFLLANAVRESYRPERFLIPFAISATLPAVAVIVVALISGVSLDQLQGNRMFLSGLGFHANELGLMLLLASGPLLFMAFRLHDSWLKAICLAIFVLVTSALVLTFSRGAFVGFLVVVAAFLVSRRQFHVLMVGVAVAAAALLFAPDAIKTRLSAGLDESSSSHILGNMNDKLTAGRVASWQLLSPDVLKSPLWGRGLGSTAWTDAVKQGRYTASHPHNLYLEILLDTGIAGFVCIVFFYWRVMGLFRGLAKAPRLPPSMQGFFAGAAASFAGVLVMGVTNGHYMPDAEQTFFWLALGMALAYWGEVYPFAVMGKSGGPTSSNAVKDSLQNRARLGVQVSAANSANIQGRTIK